MSGPEPVVLPPLTGALDRLWDLVLDLADQLEPAGWVLVGGQMVMLHGLAAGRTATRASQDVDVLADLLTDRASLSRCVQAVRRLDLAPQPDSAGKVYRFRRAADGAVVDVLAPDHSPPRWSLRTAAGGQTIQVDGGHQALQRATRLTVVKGDRSAVVPVPDLLGALVLKAAAWTADNRDRARHSGDAAFLASLVTDPLAERIRFAGSDRKRLRRLDAVLGDPDAAEWRRLGDRADDGHATWRLLLA
ncbi:Nucleotidyl transferase AbiEii toxin, Type IV TA system [Geodermatophilus obscurus]|uniref:Nucleotidyl transferase AbiEii toxin, Type IV TA system n=1 Tax=Geodermatophilus obscurus TaxID=1861 RepID=A0A1I5H3Q2_9ACTN|nr:nucleotidyl transferase AbiEii/AbiGii toxin family protein [Geodermatophilus obscurus]SFO42451.1 Nucleotidyl transferase AbiEii toxin, Type IV TA system [Geodermatophilus obscurus]